MCIALIRLIALLNETKLFPGVIIISEINSNSFYLFIV